MRRLSIDEVRQSFRKEGCELLTGQYVNNHTPLLFRCSCGEEANITYANFKKGSRCIDCGTRKANSKKSLSYDSVSRMFSERGCELLEQQYKNNYTPMMYRCLCGNISKIRLFCLLKGQKCDKCDGGRGKTHYNWNPDREVVLLNRMLQRRSRQLLLYSLKSTNQLKTGKKEYLLGYSPAQLREHFESFPQWEEIKGGKWHIDHIFPVKAFVNYGVTEIKLINCLENLRPVSASDNLRKNAAYDQDDFLSWLGTKTSNVKAIMKGQFDILFKAE